MTVDKPLPSQEPTLPPALPPRRQKIPGADPLKNIVNTVVSHPHPDAQLPPMRPERSSPAVDTTQIVEHVKHPHAKKSSSQQTIEEAFKENPARADLKTALKTSYLPIPPGKPERLGAGKAKEVHHFPDAHDNKAYFTPVNDVSNKVFNTREKEIREEVVITKEIRDKLDPSEIKNLAVDLKEADFKIDGKYTVETTKAERDLEKKICKDPPPFKEGLKLGSGFVQGMSYLHKAGYVQGDLKTENILTYPNGVAKTSDFGKTKRLGHNENVMHTGNPRFAAPEGRLSQVGEVYSSGMILIRTLEEEFLRTTDMLEVDPNAALASERSAPTTAATTDKPIRRGVEKFLVENEKCPQSEVTHIAGKINHYGRSIKLAIDPRAEINLQEAEGEINKYIDALSRELTHKYPDNKEEIKDLNILLKDMMQSSPETRIRMAQASSRLETIMQKVNK